MLLALTIVLAVVIYWFMKRRKKGGAETVRDSTPALDRWLREALEHELAEPILGLKGATEHERKPLARTLANEPDADVVGKIEDKVKAVELEFVHYAHEKDTEVTVRVRYEDGNVGTATRRLDASDVPPAVREDFEKKGAVRVFRTWAFPWQRMTTL